MLKPITTTAELFEARQTGIDHVTKLRISSVAARRYKLPHATTIDGLNRCLAYSASERELLDIQWLPTIEETLFNKRAGNVHSIRV